jgi:hypothetical protein
LFVAHFAGYSPQNVQQTKQKAREVGLAQEKTNNSQTLGTSLPIAKKKKNRSAEGCAPSALLFFFFFAIALRKSDQG